MPRTTDTRALPQLEAHGLVRRDGGRYWTTRRWQGALARTARRLVDGAEPLQDLRLPVALALLECLDGVGSDDELAALVEVMASLEVVVRPGA